MTDFKKAYEFVKNKQVQKEYNDEIVRKTWYYQKKFNFEISPKKGNEFWNNEADAFKHTYMGADLALKYDDQYSLLAGMYHEYQTPNNPPLEWNMDSWNNNQGRKIAKEIQKEYGNDYYKLPEQKQSDIIATKIMYKMRNGDLITNPTDPREYNGKTEKYMNEHPEIFKKGEKRFNIGLPTGLAADVDHIFTPEEIGNMSPDEFTQNENQIMKQLQEGKIRNNPTGFIPNIPENKIIFTREDIDKMTETEFSKHEKDIMKQMQTIGVPHNRELDKRTRTYGRQKAGYTSPSGDGKWVTINGNHVLIKE